MSFSSHRFRNISSLPCIPNLKAQTLTSKPSVASAGSSVLHQATPLSPRFTLLTKIPRSISIACWIVVFSPQILENFRRHSADGLSVFFIIVWLSGDVCNILGAVLQGVLPTMTILAVYYAFADTVLLSQCFYYRGFRFSDAPKKDVDEEEEEERPLIYRERVEEGRRKSTASDRSHKVDATHLSPATPLLPPADPATPSPPTSTFTTILFNATALALVIAAGVFGWWISRQTSPPYDHHHPSFPHNQTNRENSSIHISTPGQIFGYLCATLYLSSRLPQLLLNYRRKSTEGVSMLFFLFACVGNLTYVVSILAYKPSCARAWHDGGLGIRAGACETGEWEREYRRYIAVNASWLIGSAGTLLLDLVIFGQFWVYRNNSPTSTSTS